MLQRISYGLSCLGIIHQSACMYVGVYVHRASKAGSASPDMPGGLPSESGAKPKAEEFDAAPRGFVQKLAKSIRDFGLGKRAFFEGGVGMFVFAGIGTCAVSRFSLQAVHNGRIREGVCTTHIIHGKQKCHRINVESRRGFIQ
jgi:hypothetical protein